MGRGNIFYMNETGTQILVETIVWLKGHLEGLAMINALPELRKLKEKVDNTYEMLGTMNFPGIVYYRGPSEKKN